MIFTGILFFTLLAAVLVHHWFRQKSRRWQLVSQFPGDWPYPLVGNALHIGFQSDNFTHKLMDIWRRHGKSNFRITLGWRHWVMLCEPADIAVVLSHSTELSKTDERNTAMIPFFGYAVSTSEGERWKHIRKILAASFHFKTLEQWLESVNIYGDKLIDTLSTHAEKGNVDLYRYLRPFMFDLLCQTLMGVEANLLDQPDHKYLVASRKAVKMINVNYYSYWRHIHSLFKWTSDYKIMIKIIEEIEKNSDNIIKQRRTYLEELEKDIRKNNQNVEEDVETILQNKLSERPYLLDNLIFSKLPNGEPLPDSMIKEEISLICFTGHYTTTMTMSHTMYSMAKYPDVQRKVLEEQNKIFNNDITRKPNSKDLSEMKYLDAVIKETMRTIPTVGKIARKLHDDMVLKDGRIIPAGTAAVVYFEALFSNSKVFPEPEKFRPERFFQTMHTFAFMPFSAGPRNCIGFRYAWNAMKATISTIIRKFEISEGGPGTEPKLVYRIITESDNGIQLRLKERSL